MRHAAIGSTLAGGRCALLLALLWVAAAVSPASAAGQATVSAAADRSAIRPGEAFAVDVTLDIAKGFHTQSHTPSEPNYIPLKLTPTPTPGVTFGEPAYPPGVNEHYPNLGTLNVYTGRVTVRLPVTAAADAPAGPVKVAGVVRYQACNDNACFAPQRAAFEVTVNIGSTGDAPGGTAVAPPATTRSATSAPAVALPAEAAEPVNGGWFTLADDAFVPAFAVAFFVGLIFNCVPCVLPVVPLKIVGFYEAAQHDRRRCVLLGLAFSVGLVASFAVLALFVVVLRTLTWGGLFEHTWFTVAIVVVLTLMAASQFGLFTINLPTAAYGFSPRHDTYAGNAMFGVLTAALSTPCTIGGFSALLTWATRQPPALGAAVVITVGCGMASPYLLLSAFPEVVRKFPRTGPVGEIVKQTLAFFVLATAVYFARPLLGGRVSPPAFWWTLFAIVAAAGIFLVVRTAKALGTRRAIAISGVAALLLVAGALTATLKLARDPYDWQPYSEAAVADAAKSGRPVLIDFTADWCGNCHYLEAFVLNDPQIVRAVRAGRVLMLKADVTHGDEPAVPLKNRLATAGEIPLTAVYTPAAAKPAVLSGVYSISDLLAALPAFPGD